MTSTTTSTAPLTNSPIRVSDVEFNVNQFEASHGKSPKGFGSWAFVAYEYSRSNNYLDHVKWFNGMTYGQAKRAAAKVFAAAGVMEVVVCS